MLTNGIEWYGSVLVGLLAVSCSGSESGTKPSATGGSGGALTSAGTAAVGSAAAGGSTSQVASTALGGSTATSQVASTALGGSTAQGGSTSQVGSTATGGSSSTGGTTAKGGSTSQVGSTATGGSSSTGGSTAKGGSSSTGGTTAKGGSSSTGGTSGIGGATGDRCDVALYNAATPPVSYTISGGPSVHDPTVILVGGVYYSANSGLSLWTRNSTNLTSWTNIKQGLGGTNPSWIQTYLTAFDQAAGDLWAPDFSYFGGQYHLYYAASTFGSKTSCIGHATRAAMNTGSWTDSGGPVICSNAATYGSYTNVNWNTIDPAVILDESGNPWMVFGSGWDGIQIVRLTASGSMDSSSVITNIARRTAGVLENSYMVRRCGYYYLFMSWDKCCSGASSTYNIRVGRSTSMTGGFVDKAGVALLSGGGTKLMGDGNGWVGPGAPNIVFNGTRAYIVYHAYDATAATNVFAMHVSDLYWDSDGWPVTTASP